MRIVATSVTEDYLRQRHSDIITVRPRNISTMRAAGILDSRSSLKCVMKGCCRVLNRSLAAKDDQTSDSDEDQEDSLVNGQDVTEPS